MKLVNFLNDLFKEDGFRLIDANKREYLIGKPKKKNPIILELLDSSMHYKLLLLPELYLGEGYMDGKIKIHNGTITEFLEITLKTDFAFPYKKRSSSACFSVAFFIKFFTILSSIEW